ncbi:hypothetical protein CC1G_12504 [Coprinopsis cinerea okayama7|uniref:F-box domain-containing protein n=1 Tax=Coprinopsis cinerea (strain Okayama-7 / 130 / ATCC MYA-4618 / FGSC 9003) TaxID=240176 RepID=A8PAE8_COPC7|nr:hypothetical protein CC1G_12504 [Coprinopsis cinerea okayama7\|eukprot:XP_001839975.1 hypothetical protein CC1G_12504 [Coprinopsis cinerea okayama7\
MSVPADILFSIFDLLADDRPTQQAGCLTAKVLTSHCQRHLFRSPSFNFMVDVGPDAQDTVPVSNALACFAQALESNPCLGSYVLSFGTIVGGYTQSSEDQTKYRQGNIDVTALLRQTFSKLGNLESIHLQAGISHATPLIQVVRFEELIEIPFPNLRSLRLVGPGVSIPDPLYSRHFSWPATLQTLVIDDCAQKRPPEGKSVAGSVKTRCFTYVDSGRMPFTPKSLLDSVDPQSIHHFHFSSNKEPDRLRALEILSKSSPNLTSFTYAVPERSAGGIHTRRNRFFHKDNTHIFASLIGLETFGFQVEASDFLFNAAHPERTDYRTLPRFMASTFCSTALSAIPNITTLEIKIIQMYSVDVTTEFVDYFIDIDDYLARGPFPRLNKVRLVFNVRKSWLEKEEITTSEMRESFQLWANAAFVESKEKRGLEAEVEVNDHEGLYARYG